MTKVDFYILSGRYADQPLQFICRLVEKIYQQGHRIYLLSEDTTQAKRIDDLLWSYHQDSFIPHALVQQNSRDPDTAVHIGMGQPPAEEHDVLINLSGEVPDWFSRFSRVVEYASGNEQQKQLARVRYSFYRERGYPLVDHKI